jgi:hypothetical protein
MSRFGGWAFNQHALHVKSSSFGEEQNKKKKRRKKQKMLQLHAAQKLLPSAFFFSFVRHFIHAPHNRQC